METILYIKASDYRNRKTNLRTSIVDKDGRRYAKKECAFSEGKEHLDAIPGYAEKLKAIFEPEIKICPCKKEGDALYFDFIEGKSYEAILDELQRNGSDEEISDFVDGYYHLVNRMASGKGLKTDENFKEIFGEQSFDSDTEYGLFTDVDFIFQNIIKNESTYIIDYEWCLEFPLPVKYVFWRGLFLSKAFSRVRDELKEKIYDKYDLSIDLRERFLKMEERFVDSSRKGSVPFIDESKRIHRSVTNSADLKLNEMRYGMTFFTKKDGVAKEVFKGESHPGKNIAEVVLKAEDSEYDTIEFFVAPEASIISNISVTGIKDSEMEEQELAFTTTSESGIEEPKYFLRNTPAVIVSEKGYRHFRIEFTVDLWHAKDLAKEAFDYYLNDIKYLSNEAIGEIEKLRTELLKTGDILQDTRVELEGKKEIITSLQQKNILKATRRFLKLRKAVKNAQT